MPRGVYQHAPQASLSARLWSKVDKSGECWVWTGTTSRGYGKIQRGPRGAGFLWVHRVAWELEHGPIPLGLQVLHRCDNPPCVNPDHLFLGTRSDNMRDAASKGRLRTQKLAADKRNREAMRDYLLNLPEYDEHAGCVDPCSSVCRAAVAL